MSELIIRPVDISDARAVLEIYDYYVRETVVTFDEETPTIADMERNILSISDKWPYFVVEENGVVAGYCYVHPWKQRAAYGQTFETTVYLRHDMTSGGIGRRLMERLIDECRLRKDIHSLIACITTENVGSRRFHASIGFEEVSLFREVGFKFGRYLDVTDMELILK